MASRVRTFGGRIAAMLMLAAVAGSCSSDSLTSPTSPRQLEGTWRLFQLTSASGVHNEDLTAGRFTITFSAGTLLVRADCNGCTGPYSLSGNALTVGPLACTRAACSSAPLDSRFTDLLNGSLTVRINDRLLQLNNAQGGELRLEK